MAKKKKNRAIEALNRSPINYFSDLFIAAMVVCWILVMVIMVVMAIFSTVQNADNSIWSDLAGVVTVPLSAGGAVWMVKNGVQHAISNMQGREAKADFAKVDGTEIEREAAVTDTGTGTESEEACG